MVALKADEAIQAWLKQASERVEVRGTNGELLGYFEPRHETEDELYERAKKLFDLDELERRKATDREGFTLGQVMEHLRSLEGRE